MVPYLAQHLQQQGHVLEARAAPTSEEQVVEDRHGDKVPRPVSLSSGPALGTTPFLALPPESQ